jgi:chromosome partitioning protein
MVRRTLPPQPVRVNPGISHMRTIAIINQKGGCGKTTTSINLAACLARLGQKTLLVDMDPQGHCGTGLAVPEEQIERTIYDALLEPSDGKDAVGGRPAKVAEVVWQIASDFDLAPSNIRLSAFEQVFAGRPGREDRLSLALAGVKSTYQWCIVDCPPSVGLITFNALKAADEVVVPVETGYFSLHGLAKMMETLEVMRERSGRDVTIRVLPTLYDTRTKLAREVLSELKAKFRDHLMESTVNFNTKLKEAASFGQPITEYDPGSRGYKDFVNLARELMGHRPLAVEPTAVEQLSRPAELVQRAKQLAQLANYQFGRSATSGMAGMTAPAPAAAAAEIKPPSLDRPTQDRPSELPTRMPAAANRVAQFDVDAGPAGGASTPSFTSTSATAVLAPPTMAARPRTEGVARPAQRIDARPAPRAEPSCGVRQQADGVLFAARFDGAARVLIAGDFNNWSAMSTPMWAATPGLYQAKLPLMPGRYRYRFVVDGRWMTDPHNATVEVNQFGEMNNVVEVR